MSNTDTIVSMDQDDSAQLLDLVGEFSLDPQSPKLASAMFGTARKRSLSKLKEPSRRDSPTLPWQGSIRSLRKDSVDVRDSPKGSKSLAKRPDSPDIDTILAKTPRPRRKTSSALLSSPRSRGGSTSSRTSPNIGQKPLPGLPLSAISLLEDDSDMEGGGGSESDSSIDIHTPLPHLMFRDGLLSPRSKLLPQSTPSSQSIYSFAGSSAAGSVLSLASTAGSVKTKSGLQKDPRDTERRRVRHRDGRLLKAGMGLTTGLGWSDSEDEDAPSALTRRLIATTIERQRATSVTSSRPTSLYDSTSASRLSSPVPSPASPSLARKPLSHSNLRSSSVSFPAKSPASPLSGPGQGLRIPRGRAASAAAVGPSRAGIAKPVLPPLTSRSPSPSERINPASELSSAVTGSDPSPLSAVSETTTASSVSLITASSGRSRAESSASTASNTTATSLGSSSAPLSRILPKSAPAVSATPFRPPIAPAVRARTTSGASTSTDATASSAASSYSQGSSSTSVPSSSSSHVPRPLRLPQAPVTGLKQPTRSFSQDTYATSTTNLSIVSAASIQQRARTLSNPQSMSGRRTPISGTRVLTTSNSLSSGVLPPGAPPTLRHRQTPSGARPRPRTGTGMAYRTSSYTSFHESGALMRGSSVVSP